MSKPIVDATASPRDRHFEETNQVLNAVQVRLREIQLDYQISDEPGFSKGSIQSVLAISDLFLSVGARMTPCIFEGDDSCPNIVYDNFKTSRRISIDISYCGRQVEVWRSDSKDSLKLYAGKFDVNELRRAAEWLIFTHEHKRPGQNLNLAA